MRLTLLLLATLVLGCTNSKNEKIVLQADNPFLVNLNEPIAYAKVNANHIKEYVNVTIHNSLLDIESIKSKDVHNFENTFKTYDRINNELDKVYCNTFLLNWVSADSLVRIEGTKGYQKIDSVITEIRADKDLFKTFKGYVDSDDGKLLQGNKKILANYIIEDFKQYGVNLNKADLKTYKTLIAQINKLSAQYSTNMNTAEEYLILNEEEIDGLPENFKDTYTLENGTYKIPVINATSLVKSNASSSQVRKAYATKIANIAAEQNLPILDSLVSKRHQLGVLMGYDSYAGYNLANKMAKTPEKVWDFIDGLLAESKIKALKDIEVLKTVRNTHLNTPNDDSAIDPWDYGYYFDQLLKTKYNLDYEKMREYLPMDACLEGMLTLYQELLGLKFKKVENPSVWHKDVTMYEVYEGEKLKGSFYLDLYPRPNKETWFYGVPLKWGSQTAKGYEVPVAMLLGNFTKATDKLPSLISFNELTTLFHEFGHIVDMMSYEGEFSLLANTKDDFAEAMSQIFENWIDDYDILSSFAKHYKTGEVFPKELFNKKIEAKNAGSGLLAQLSLRYCLYDMNLYDKFNPNNFLNTNQLWKDIDTKMGVMDYYIEGTHPQASWIHINTNPTYYYGYLWSEVYAQDMFTEFKKNGLRDTETGIRYRKIILANGAQRDIDEAVEAFLGRPTNNKAYIKSLGLE
ncbi:M3 family metallopeptidase [Polaribacter sargassicola]|uniref:M3 family metallopeptidase n=1 Tax=Polaribacter sargassicola TaxID=2836891 RepID=UPI001F1FC995|nr:M3 family metallopeptidase [Polaribacter sp. DS7-9]MCG1037673.1 Zn-dependent oligopeptidase [Polaribacter sp. DS7-9]